MKKHTADIKTYDDKIARILAAAKDSSGNTLLYYAVQEGNLYLARLLVKEDVDVNTKDNEDLTPLHAAAISNAKDVAEFLVDNGADVDARDNIDWTPLHTAAFFDAEDVAELLISKGANIRARNNKNKAPFEIAQGEVVTFLAVAKGNSGNTLLHYAAKEGNLDLIELLIKEGADINARNNDNKTPFKLALDL
ncbi:ankyrin repeat domain-containing protein [Wolbachia endosymbiont of Cimex lectularius]|uniref:ankyrin repeat domain-containing protein n=1 Tax=Wolbachia endosymbiont of Cimex lectularius TaxID=246273 RepID=UPI00049A5ADB|nr:ankyrin repeat domain-containing protein [Wolbachia endosymbiont of Cimex lectularius]BAO99793.1 ankyrin repeat-containing protein [Wolbachia endosymbiont of Cimex lectularius]